MDDYPILFSGPMVRSILDGQKTQTRRVIAKAYDKPALESAWAVCPADDSGWIAWFGGNGITIIDIEDFTKRNYKNGFQCPYGTIGDRLWVRETWCRTGAGCTLYRADYSLHGDQPYWNSLKWKPSIHMPRALSRITLEITDIRVQRLQEITEEDARAEGFFEDDAPWPTPAREWFSKGWDGLYAKRGYSWESNPWVWAISFKRAK